jgi:hypothetical protein
LLIISSCLRTATRTILLVEDASLDTIEPMYRSKSIIDIYDFDDDAAVQNGIVNELVGMGFGGLYIDDPPNSSLG